MKKKYEICWRRNTLPEGNWNNVTDIDKVLSIIMDNMKNYDNTLYINIIWKGEAKNSEIDIIDDVKIYGEKPVKKNSFGSAYQNANISYNIIWRRENKPEYVWNYVKDISKVFCQIIDGIKNENDTVYIIVNTNINGEGEEIEGYNYDDQLDPDDAPIHFHKKIPLMVITKLVRWLSDKGMSEEDIRDCISYIRIDK